MLLYLEKKILKHTYMLRHRNSNSGIRAMIFICMKLIYMFWKEFQNLIFSWYMRCIDEYFKSEIYFKFNFRTYSWYVKACIALNFVLEQFLVHNYVIYRSMHKSKILFDLIHDSYMRYMIAYLDLQYDSWFVYEI